jgi:hypothetical protein
VVALATKIRVPETLPVEQEPGPDVAYWLARLGAQLDIQTQDAVRYDRYYAGVHEMMFATPKFRETFGFLFGAFADNWCQVVVDSSLERLSVNGFRFGAKETYEGDAAAWEIWQQNDLDKDSTVAHLEAIKTGHAYVLVDAGDPPRITVESPIEVTVAYAPGNRRQRVAALKRWIDIGNYLHATLYLPDVAWRFISTDPWEQQQELAWTLDDPATVPNATAPVVPVLELTNNPGLIANPGTGVLGHSDLEPVIPLQTAIDKICADMMVASEYAAYRQRWATGIEMPVDPETGEKRPDWMPKLLSDPSRMWASERGDTRFGSFDASDLGNYTKAVEMFIQHLAAQTRTPPHYLTAGLGQWPSGDSLKASEVGLVAKVKRKQQAFAETWEEAMRLAFVIVGDQERAGAKDAETMWTDPEYRSEAERVDALVKMRTLGVPLEALWEKWGATPQEITRWKSQLQDQAAILGLAAAYPVTTTGREAQQLATNTGTPLP